MNTGALLRDLRGKGVTHEAYGLTLRVVAPREVATPELREQISRHKHALIRLLERERKRLEEADRRGLVIRWSREPGWISLHNPTTGEWHDIKASECPPSIVESARSHRRRGERDVDEPGLQRALYRSSMGEIEHALGSIVKGRKVVVEGRLTGTGRSAIERLGGEVDELRLEDEKRYIDMTPIVFVFAALAMAVRYISLGIDDQDLYILAGIGFALMYGLRPFFSRMQRPRDE